MSVISLDSTVIRSVDQVSTHINKETIILSLASDEYYSLRDVGARIWTLLETPQTARQILAALVREYDVAPEPCERDLLAILQDMANEGLVEIR